MIRSLTRSTINNEVWYQSMLAGNEAYDPNALKLISTSLISTNTASVTFSSLNTYSQYKHLQLRIVGRSSRADFQDQIAIRYNGLSTATYAFHNLRANGSNLQSGASTGSTEIFSLSVFDLFAASETANLFGVAIIDILDFANANTTKTLKMLSGLAGGTQVRNVMETSGFNTTAGALTSITIFPKNGSWVSGSRISLYGIKG